MAVVPSFVQGCPLVVGKSGWPARGQPPAPNHAGHLDISRARWSSIWWYGHMHRAQAACARWAAGVVLWHATWQQHPCVTDAPNAPGSALLAGSVRVAVRCTAFIDTERTSALASSISRSIHQAPIMSVVRGCQGPASAQLLGPLRNEARRSRMRPSHRFAGPMPRRTLRSMSVIARLVAGDTRAPWRSAVARAW